MGKRASAKPDPQASLPPYTIETWKIDRVKPYARNARLHPKEQIKQLRSSFQRFGQVWPILVREDGTIIAGHGRLEAAKLEGFGEIRVIIAAGWSAEQCRAFGLLDNRVALNAEWDDEALKLELGELMSGDIPLWELGFDDAEVDALLKQATEAVEHPAGRSLAPVIQFNIVFDNEQQQETWFQFVRQLKAKYPDLETLGCRLARHLTEAAADAKV